MTFSLRKANGKYFSYKNKHRIYFHEIGQGEPLLLLHGFPTASWDFHKIEPILAERYRVISFDFIGFGFSDKPTDYDYSIMDQADLTEAFMDYLGVDAAHILAHDYGDTVLQELMARVNDRRQSKVDGFEIFSSVFLNGGIFPETHHARLVQKVMISPIGFITVPFLRKRNLKNSFYEIFGDNTPPTDQEIDEFYELIMHNGGKKNLYKLIRYMSDRKKYRVRWVHILQNPVCPIRVINGGADPVSGTHMTVRYRELVPDADIVVREDIGHYPQTEAPEWVLETYLEFRATVEVTAGQLV